MNDRARPATSKQALDEFVESNLAEIKLTANINRLIEHHVTADHVQRQEHAQNAKNDKIADALFLQQTDNC